MLQINGGMKGGRKWYQGIEIGMGGGTAPVSRSDSNAPSGTTIAILFHKPLEPMKAAEIKKLLAPVLDFEKRSATELYADTLPPEVQKAIKEKRALEGMDREQVVMALGRPDHKSREVKDGMELEDWVFGQPPGKIVFVTFNGNKVIKVKEVVRRARHGSGRSEGAPLAYRTAGLGCDDIRCTMIFFAALQQRPGLRHRIHRPLHFRIRLGEHALALVQVEGRDVHLALQEAA